MRPGVGDLELAQGVGQVVGIAPGDEEGGAALQHGDMGALAGNRRISVAAVAPEPITTTRLPVRSRSSGQVCGCTTRPWKRSMPGQDGV